MTYRDVAALAQLTAAVAAVMLARRRGDAWSSAALFVRDVLAESARSARAGS